jgi:hypothetical protein
MKMNIRFCSLLLLLGLCSCTTTEQLKNRYSANDGVKAFAEASNEISGAAWGQTTYKDAIQLAMYYCQKGGGINCKITDLDGRNFSLKPQSYVLSEESKREYNCSSITLGQAYSYLQQGHYYLDLDGDGHPCEWGAYVKSWKPQKISPLSRSQSSNCHWVNGYTRKDGTRVKGHQRCN